MTCIACLVPDPENDSITDDKIVSLTVLATLCVIIDVGMENVLNTLCEEHSAELTQRRDKVHSDIGWSKPS
jgi:hypothetical protein